jgi:hypothetical protein
LYDLRQEKRRERPEMLVVPETISQRNKDIWKSQFKSQNTMTNYKRQLKETETFLKYVLYLKIMFLLKVKGRIC